MHSADRSSGASITSIPDLALAAGPRRSSTPTGSSRAHPTQSYTALSQRIREAGLLDRTRWFYLALTTGLVMLLGGAGVGLVLIGDSWLQLLIAGALGLIFTQLAFLAHEAGHRQVLRSGPGNDWIGRIVGTFLVGMSYQWWMSKHSRHHGNPNKVGKDPDIAFDTISFTEESAAEQRGLMAFLTRRQGYLFFPLLLLEGVNLHYTSVKSLVTRGPVKGRWLELGLLAVRFGVYLALLLWLLPVGMACAFLGVQLAVFGVYMGSTFAPNHKGMPIISREERLDFFTKQVRTSRNITGGWWASVLMGGLNYQVEHHLFPNMPRPHLARARVLVREHCRALDVPYTETSLGRSYAIVIDYLNRVGLAARDPFECPLMNSLR